MNPLQGLHIFGLETYTIIKPLQGFTGKHIPTPILVEDAACNRQRHATKP